MKCWKCGKEMDREDGGTTLKGIEVRVQLTEEHRSQADIAYYKEQLGEYSSDDGQCDIALCYECYIDRLFSS